MRGVRGGQQREYNTGQGSGNNATNGGIGTTGRRDDAEKTWYREGSEPALYPQAERHELEPFSVDEMRRGKNRDNAGRVEISELNVKMNGTACAPKKRRFIYEPPSPASRCAENRKKPAGAPSRQRDARLSHQNRDIMVSVPTTHANHAQPHGHTLPIHRRTTHFFTAVNPSPVSR